MFNNRNNHSQMPNQEERICTLKKRTLLMYMPHKCSGFALWKGSCSGELLRKAVLSKRRGGGRRASYNSGSFPVEVSDTMKVHLGLALCVNTTTHWHPVWLPSSSWQNSMCGMSIHQKYLLKCGKRRELCVMHLKGIKKRKENQKTLCLKDKKAKQEEYYLCEVT